MDNEKRYCVAVHVGAGVHSVKKTQEYKECMRLACTEAAQLLKMGASSNDAVERAICILEDSPVTNAGVGSNLTRSGSVECDASMMSTDPNGFGAVGAVSEIINPIKASNLIMKINSNGPNQNGLVPPMLLVSKGADQWASINGIPISNDPKQKITDVSLKEYRRYMEIINSGDSPLVNTPENDTLMDTVGAVCIDIHGNISSGVSSGGIALKHPGRIGEAALFGAGCWAEHIQNESVKVGCSVTGTGEQIIQTMLARNCAQRSGGIFEILEDCMNDFKSSPFLSNYKNKYAGLILLRYDYTRGDIELGIAQTTPSIGYGYISNSMSKPKVSTLIIEYMIRCCQIRTRGTMKPFY